MKLGIIGTRGIPNNYGGFEQFAEYLSRGLVERGHEVSVYGSHDHPYREEFWNKVKIIRKLNPEKHTGTWGQFVYDFLCILDSRRRGFDIILQLGYTSNSVWGWMLPRKAIIVTNMDGLEWKRAKYNWAVQQFLKVAEWLAVKTSHHLIADSVGIKNYLLAKYGKQSEYIAYGTHVFGRPSSNYLERFELSPGEYSMLIARMEPENNVETILDGVARSKSRRQFLVIGNYRANRFGLRMKAKFEKEGRIRFLGSIYDIELLNNLRYFSHLYFHGHSVGGTNPSLLEAMASQSLICAHENEFNRSVLGEDALYFRTKEEVSIRLDSSLEKVQFKDSLHRNLKKVESLYLWQKIVDDCESFFSRILNSQV